MNISRDFLNSLTFRRFKRELQRDDALEFFVRIGSYCESIKSPMITVQDLEELAWVLCVPEDLDIQDFVNACIRSGVLSDESELGNHSFRAILWEEQNAKLIANWNNGKQGGRPKKRKHSKRTSSSEPIPTEATSIETKPMEGNRTDAKRKEANRSEDKEWVSQSKNPSQNPFHKPNQIENYEEESDIGFASEDPF